MYRQMRAFLALILVSALCSGCFVFDEIEKGQEIMAAHSPNSEPGKGGASDSSASPKTAREKLAEYYAKQRARASSAPKSEDPADAVGSCRVHGSVQFLRRADCKLRGGTFL